MASQFTSVVETNRPPPKWIMSLTLASLCSVPATVGPSTKAVRSQNSLYTSVVTTAILLGSSSRASPGPELMNNHGSFSCQIRLWVKVYDGGGWLSDPIGH